MPIEDIHKQLQPEAEFGETTTAFISSTDVIESFEIAYEDVVGAINTHESDPDAHGNTYIKKIGDVQVGPIALKAHPIETMHAATRGWVESAITLALGGGSTQPDDAGSIIAAHMFS